VPTQVPGNPKILFRLGDFNLPVEITHAEIFDGWAAVKGIQIGKFAREECLVFIGPKIENYRENEDSWLTHARFWCEYSGRRNSFRRHQKPMIQEEKSDQSQTPHVFDSENLAIIVITKNRAESIGLSLPQLKVLWGKPHSASIIEGEYICLHGKEAQ